MSTGSEPGRERLPELLGINVEVGWNCDWRCLECYRFFECPAPQKLRIYREGRLPLIRERLGSIGLVLAVLSGKGGVGKSTISAALAAELARRGHRVGVVDLDLHGPSLVRLLGLRGPLRMGPRGIVPARGALGIQGVSMGLLLGEGEPLLSSDVWKRECIEELLAHTDFGPLDVLLLDLPPGTGSTVVNLLKYLPPHAEGLLVTGSTALSAEVSRRCATLCRLAKLPLVGVVENMSGAPCPRCGLPLVGAGGGERLARELGLPLLACLPWDPAVQEACDRGDPAALPLGEALRGVVEALERRRLSTQPAPHEVPRGPLLEVRSLNVELGCRRSDCLGCEQYFRCQLPRRQAISRQRPPGARRVLAVLSGKGGVGKSTISAALAAELARRGHRVGVVDLDLHGPSLVRLLGLRGPLRMGPRGIVPARGALGIQGVSMGLLLGEGEPTSWFDVLKRGALRELLFHTDFGPLDVLLLDLPPGTGAVACAVVQLVDLDGAILVSMPTAVAWDAVERCLGLLREGGVRVLGWVENMSGVRCPHCGFRGDDGMLPRPLRLPLLASIPLDLRISEAGDGGRPLGLEEFQQLAERVIAQLEPHP